MSASGPQPQLKLSLRLEPGGGPPAGVVQGERERVEFRGWIELAAVIESLRAQAPVAPAPAPARRAS